MSTQKFFSIDKMAAAIVFRGSQKYNKLSDFNYIGGN
jgi:hypothetical protein